METVKSIHIFINNRKFELEKRKQTGASLKELAGIPLGDVLFLQRPCEDEVIDNDAVVLLRDCDRLHSQPTANYGYAASAILDAGIPKERIATHAQPHGWTFLVVSDYQLPRSYRPDLVELLIKLPPQFPDAAPDMFWVNPAVTLEGSRMPRSTTSERLLGKDWQRFSWHLDGGAWQPGRSGLRDFLRCVRGRFLRGD